MSTWAYRIDAGKRDRLLFKSSAAKSFTAAPARGNALEQCQSHLEVDNMFHWNKTKTLQTKFIMAVGARHAGKYAINYEYYTKHRRGQSISFHRE